MAQQIDETKLPGRSIDIMRRIREHGGYICTGSCKQIRKGQLHCRNLGNMLGMGPATVWEVVNALIDAGILERSSDQYPITITLTAKGDEILDHVKD